MSFLSNSLAVVDMNISHVILNQILFFFFTSIHRHLIITQPPSVTKSVHPITRTQKHAELRKFYHRQNSFSRLPRKVPWQTIIHELIFFTPDTTSFNDRRFFSENFLHTQENKNHNIYKSKIHYTNNKHPTPKKLIMTSQSSHNPLDIDLGNNTRSGINSNTDISDPNSSERKQEQNAPHGIISPKNNVTNTTSTSETISTETGCAMEKDLPSDITNYGIHGKQNPTQVYEDNFNIGDLYVAQEIAKRLEEDQSDLNILANPCTSWTNPDHAHYTIAHHILSVRTKVSPCVREKHNLIIDDDDFTLTFLDIKHFLDTIQPNTIVCAHNFFFIARRDDFQYSILLTNTFSKQQLRCDVGISSDKLRRKQAAVGA